MNIAKTILARKAFCFDRAALMFKVAICATGPTG